MVEDFPFALLTYAASVDTAKGTSVARRDVGAAKGVGTLRIAKGTATFSGECSACVEPHGAALALAAALAPGALDGEYPVVWREGHRAPVEAGAEGITIECTPALAADQGDALALAWVAALTAYRTRDSRAALRRVAEIYTEMKPPRTAALQAALAESIRAAGETPAVPGLDAGNLCSIYLHRAARETEAVEQERWISWFLGHRRVDLPYNRAAVIRIMEDEATDPDLKRLQIHDVILSFDNDIERRNIARLVRETRAAGQELIFGRLCRAFHNQSLLFANAGYVQVDEAIRAQVTSLTEACADANRLAPAADRLRMLIHGAAETALTGVIGALELLEDAILDNQAKEVAALLQEERESVRDADALDAEGIMKRTGQLLGQCRELRAALQAAPRRSAAYVLLSQRIFPTETYLLTRINEVQEPYLGKPENLKALVRSGGHRMYASPDYSWLRYADHWVEAIPLFIKERVLVVDGEEITETVIDQAAMEETFREQFADHWAANIDNVTDSEHVALAREFLARTDGRIVGDDRGRAQAIQDLRLQEKVAHTAAIIAAAYRGHAAEIHLEAERAGCSRYDALRHWLDEHLYGGTETSTTRTVELLANEGERIKADTARLTAIADQPRRPLPALHVLTTQSARMSDSYVRTWLEESMALGNVIRAHDLEGEVKARMTNYRTLIGNLGKRLIHDLGMAAEVQEMMALENIPEAVAIMRVIAGNAGIARQVALLGVLGEQFGLGSDAEAPLVEELLASQADTLREGTLRAVYERNDLDLLPKLDAYRAAHPEASEAEAIRELVLNDSEYADDIMVFMRFAAREEAIKDLDRRDPSLKIAAQVRDWLRLHTRLALTTARRETLLAHGLQGLTLHPLYYYRAAGGNKRFHQLYTPSRVDLGTRERETVETWSQWVGGADRTAARVGRRVYGLINKNPKMFDSLTEPEVLKSGENASMVAHFSYSNAMSLLINSVGRGDVEEIGDQMSLRKDRHIHPGGEGYGGYCVPKDGLFLEFVLILTRATKLQQLGVPDALHGGLVKLAFHLLSKRGDFPAEIEWEAWAMGMLEGKKELEPFFSVRTSDDGPVPVFQITRLAVALTQLGRPELTDSFDVLSNLAARWGVHKIIVGGEQVNRFMPFFKTWLTYKAIEDAARLNPRAGVKTRDFSVVLSAEYKPDTQDGRYSVGMRKFEIFAGTGEHLMYSLDVPGQDIAHLMLHGFGSLWAEKHEPRTGARLRRLLQELQVREDDAEGIARLHELFPGYGAPAEVRMVSPMMLTAGDLLHYTSDTQLEPLALEARRRLLNVGLTDQEIDANMQVYGPRLARWTKLRDLPTDELAALAARIGGAVHALALSIIGPAGNYEMAVQGADVVDTGIPNKDLLLLIADPVRLRDMMLEGNPGSALVIVDGASGARRRAMNKLAVQRWFAAGEALERQAIYRCVGVGTDTAETWREEMREQRGRAQDLLTALRTSKAGSAEAAYARIITDLRDGQEAALTLEGEERMLRFNKRTEQEAAVARAVTAVAGGLPLRDLDFGTWLALGGQFEVMGKTEAEIARLRTTFERAIAAMHGKPEVDDQVVKALVCPAYVPAVEDFREEKGIESSNKATEEVATVAMDTRKRLAERAARARALRDREDAFKATLAEYGGEISFTALLAAAREARGDGSCITQPIYGRVQALTRLALTALGRKLFAEATEHQDLLVSHLETAFVGRVLDPFYVRPIIGGYEDVGDIARLAQGATEALRAGTISEAERDAVVAKVADAAELLDCCMAMGYTIDFFVVDPQTMEVWRGLADFFAESLNDHNYEYRPWAYSRGAGFAHISGDALYELAVSHHQWLYRYLRGIVLRFTEMKDMDPAHVAELLGDMEDPAARPAIGADGFSAIERRWRAYNQLREIAFMRNDGFPLPEVFPAFDPEIIQASTRTNLLFMLPPGRTHVSRALMEGPTLNGELTAAGGAGANLLISRTAVEAEIPGASRPVLQVRDAFLYITAEEYAAAAGSAGSLPRSIGVPPASEKGIRVAVRFTAPVTCAVVFPFHGHPLYMNGRMEDLGLPYSAQSLFHTWTTYDKAKYPAIFHRGTGVAIPGEIDWLASYTAALGAERARHAIEHGSGKAGKAETASSVPARTPDAVPVFPGLRAFAKQYRLIMVKDAAESGGRGQKAFTLRTADGKLDDAAIAEATEFVHQISLRHNVAIQEVVISNPEAWATEEFMASFTDRQIQEWGVAVNRDRRPRTALYGSHRLILSSDKPTNGQWHVSHPITLNSRQLITNVGRGGTLDLFLPEWIRPEYREQLWRRLVEAGEKTMVALTAYETAAPQYTAETGRPVGCDATGLSYAVPRYMMLDFIVQPIFAEEGTLVDLEPTYAPDGTRTGARFILRRGDTRIPGTVTDWRVVLIEPNIGIGLWDRVAIREEFYAVTKAETPDWSAVGANARVVLRDLAQAGRDYLQAITK